MKQLLILPLFLLNSVALAESLPPEKFLEPEACINGDLKNNQIVGLLGSSEAQLVSDFYEAQGFSFPEVPAKEIPVASTAKSGEESPSIWQYCYNHAKAGLARFSNLFGSQPGNTIAVAAVADAFNKEMKLPTVQRFCIEAALKRDIKQDAFICTSENAKAKSTHHPGPNGQCINDQYVDYIHFAVNRALSCLSPLADPIDPAFIFQKMNNESGFNLNFAYEGGAGLGQLTSDPVEELTGFWDKTKKGTKVFLNGNGRAFIMERMANTDDPKCKAFSDIAKKDLAQPPPVPPFKPEHFCKYGDIGNGVTRSLLYGVGYYLHMRENIVKPALKKRSAALVKNKRLVNLLTLVSYGPGGPSRSETLVEDLRLEKWSAKIAEKKVINASEYLQQTEKKMDDMITKLPNDGKPKDSSLGSPLCVSN